LTATEKHAQFPIELLAPALTAVKGTFVVFGLIAGGIEFMAPASLVSGWTVCGVISGVTNVSGVSTITGTSSVVVFGGIAGGSTLHKLCSHSSHSQPGILYEQSPQLPPTKYKWQF
jgi:hypothetical protein